MRAIALLLSTALLHGCCCCCPDIPGGMVPDDLEQMAGEKGAEIMLEKMMGEGVDVTLDVDAKTWRIDTKDGHIQAWGEPGGPPSGFKLPPPPEGTVEAAVVAESTKKDQPSRVEYLIIEHEGSREAIRDAYMEWAKGQGITVQELKAEEMAAEMEKAREQMKGVQLPGGADVDMPKMGTELDEHADIVMFSSEDSPKRGGYIVMDDDGGMVVYVEGDDDPGEVIDAVSLPL